MVGAIYVLNYSFSILAVPGDLIPDNFSVLVASEPFSESNLVPDL